MRRGIDEEVEREDREGLEEKRGEIGGRGDDVCRWKGEESG